MFKEFGTVLATRSLTVTMAILWQLLTGMAQYVCSWWWLVATRLFYIDGESILQCSQPDSTTMLVVSYRIWFSYPSAHQLLIFGLTVNVACIVSSLQALTVKRTTSTRLSPPPTWKICNFATFLKIYKYGFPPYNFTLPCFLYLQWLSSGVGSGTLTFLFPATGGDYCNCVEILSLLAYCK